MAIICIISIMGILPPIMSIMPPPPFMPCIPEPPIPDWPLDGAGGLAAGASF